MEDFLSHPVLVEVTRGPVVENRHRASVAIASAAGEIVDGWGGIESPVLPRSSIKIVQALPLVESGAADAARLNSEHLALACASHQGAAIHTERIADWLAALGMGEGALLCGPQPPRDPVVKARDRTPTRLLNNCSGKHTGFLTLSQHLGADPRGYLDPAAAVQSAVAEAFSAMTGAEPPLTFGFDGCSAPNFAAPLSGIARAMAQLADPERLGGVRGAAAERLVAAMRAHPLLVSGEGRACAALSGATGGRVVVKTGADGVFTGIDPESKLGFCLKIDDGDAAAAEALCAAVLVRIGAAAADDPAIRRYTHAEIRNWNGEITGHRRAVLDAA